jgi:hypothetical protein
VTETAGKWAWPDSPLTVLAVVVGYGSVYAWYALRGVRPDPLRRERNQLSYKLDRGPAEQVTHTTRKLSDEEVVRQARAHGYVPSGSPEHRPDGRSVWWFAKVPLE